MSIAEACVLWHRQEALARRVLAPLADSFVGVPPPGVCVSLWLAAHEGDLPALSDGERVLFRTALMVLGGPGVGVRDLALLDDECRALACDVIAEWAKP